VIGRYELTREDVLSGRKFEDAVARGSWPIELWKEGRPGATYEYLEDGQSYDIPLRCLQAQDLGNLFVAGRCLSASHEALGSARVIGTCLATGEAAGRAAAARRRGGRPAMNLAEFLQSSGERLSERPAVTDVGSGGSLTYGELAREAERVAAFLRARVSSPASGSGSWRRTASPTCPPPSASWRPAPA